MAASGELHERPTGRPAAALDTFFLLEQAVAYTLAGLALATPALLPRATPCAGWDLRMLLRHVGESMEALTEGFMDGYVGPGPGPPPGADVAGSLRHRAARLLAAGAAAGEGRPVRVAGRTLTANVLAAAGAIEVGVHGWDIFAACGDRRAVPPVLAAELLRLAPLLVTADTRSGLFAAPVPAPGLAPPGDQLVAFLGRDPRWHPRTG